MLDRLLALRVAVPSENRLGRARELVVGAEALHVQLGASDVEMELQLAEASKTIFEQHVIVSGLRHLDDVARKKLGIMLRGDPMPEEARAA